MSVVTLIVTTSLSSLASERRFDKSIQVIQLKEKLELITGSTAGYMSLQLFDKKDGLVCTLSDDNAMLGAYPVQDFMRLHVIDTDPHKKRGEFEDTSRVEKYEMDEDEYEKLGDSVRAFKKRNKLGRFADDAADPDMEGAEDAQGITVGARCEVTVDASLAKRGTVRFVGKAHFKPGYWVGVQYDEPLGKNNGSVDGKKYFECPNNYGAFVRPKFVRVGDYPEEDLGLSDDEM
eukprot:Opistho-1_new@42799